MTNDIDQLNAFLRHELSSVETYRQCIEQLDNPIAVSGLKALRESHVRRSRDLAAQVRHLGGKPAKSSGIWGNFAKLVEGGAKVLGEAAAVAVLEQGERLERSYYHRNLEHLSPTAQDYVYDHILSEQIRTLAHLRQLRDNLKQPYP